MTRLYEDVMTHKYNLERQVLQNSSSLATLTPDIFAYNVMNGPGYMATTAGEVIYIVKWTPAETIVRHTKECYQELPVLKSNITMFLTQKTDILLKKGTQIECNPFIPPMYKMNNEWFKSLPKPTESMKPITLEPLTKRSWQYVNPMNLATSGIHAFKDL